MLSFDLRARYLIHVFTKCGAELRSQSYKLGAQRNVKLNVDLGARYSVSTENGAEFLSQSWVFDAQTNVDLTFYLRTRYSGNYRIWC